jgi:hypothetical protein
VAKMRAGTGANRCQTWTAGEGVKSIEAALRQWAPGLFGDAPRASGIQVESDGIPFWRWP